MDIAETDALMALCRTHGVSCYEQSKEGFIRIEFFPPVPTVVKPDEKKPEKDKRPNGLDAALNAI